MPETNINLLLTWLDRTGDVLCRFLDRHLPERRGKTANWWAAWVWPVLSPIQQQGLHDSVELARRKELSKNGELDELDLIALLRVFRKNWDFLKPNLAPEAGDYKDGYACIQPVNDIRNKFSHRKIKNLRSTEKQLADDLDKIRDFLYLLGTDSGLMHELGREIEAIRKKTAPSNSPEPIKEKPAEAESTMPAYALPLSENLERTLVHAEEIPAREARREDFPIRMMADIRSFLRKRGIGQLYRHQAHMFDHVLDGKDVVITTGTASGKTLSFLLPIFQTMLGDPDARALFIYPTNALVYDQLQHIENDLKILGNMGIRVGRYDGTMDAADKKRTRQYANLILTNPEMVNQGLLARHTENETIMSNLRFVVLDELHAYHGAFGAHLSNIIRRLNRLCATRYYQESFSGRPQYLCCTATIGNPAELAELMTGKKGFELIGQEDDGSPQPPRNVYFFSPSNRPSVSSHDDEYDSLASDVAGREAPQDKTPGFYRLVAEGIESLRRTRRKSITFVKSRSGTDKVAEEAEAVLGHHGTVRAYSAKESVETKLKIIKDFSNPKSDLVGIASTNALEVGIDIGSVGGVVVAGFPRSKASFWQQIGRAGRALGNEGASPDGSMAHCLMISDGHFLSEFVCQQPQWVLDRHRLECVVVNPFHENIRKVHLQAAAFEYRIDEESDWQWFVDPDDENDEIGTILTDLCSENRLKYTSAGHFISTGSDSIAHTIRIRCADDTTYRFQIKGRERRNEDEENDSPTMDEMQAMKELYKGAVHRFKGKPHLVVEHKRKDIAGEVTTGKEPIEAIGVPIETRYFTSPLQGKILELQFQLKQGLLGRHETGYGHVKLRISVSGFQIHTNFFGKKTIWGYQNYPSMEENGEISPGGFQKSSKIQSIPDWLAREIEENAKRLTFLPEDNLRKTIETKGVWIRIPDAVENFDKRSVHEKNKCLNKMSLSILKRELFDSLCYGLYNAAKTTVMCGDSDLDFFSDMVRNPVPWSFTEKQESVEIDQPEKIVVKKGYLCFFDLYPGGLGFSEKVFGRFKDLLEQAISNVRNCHCRSQGLETCPVCAGPLVNQQESLLTRELILWGLSSFTEDAPLPDDFVALLNS